MDLNHCHSHINVQLLTTNDGPDQESNTRKRQIVLNEMHEGHEGANDDELKVDFVLVYISGEDEDKRSTRECYEDNLESRGLILEDVCSEKDPNLHFVKVFAPLDVLCQKAEDMNIQMPMEKEPEIPRISSRLASPTSKGFLEDIYEKHKHLDPFRMTTSSVNPKRTKIAFSKANKEAFKSMNGKYFFENAVRSRMVHRILQLTSYTEDEEVVSHEYEEEEDDNSREGGHGIEELSHNGVYKAYFPLHDALLASQNEEQSDPMNDRQRLRNDWASLSMMFKYQPLRDVRKYCGVRVSFYFAWLGVYNSALVPAAVVGVLCFLYALATFENHAPLQEICDQSNEKLFYMCPQCDRHCSYYSLTSTCVYSKIARTFDNGATVFFSVFMSIWATLFLEYWKRTEASLAFDWDVFGLLKEYEPLRPEFVVKVKEKKKNEVTNKEEPFIPRGTRIRRGLGAFGVVCTMILVVVGTLVGIIVYRASILAAMYAQSSNDLRENAKLITSFTAASINLIIIQCLTQLYYKIAEFLTKWENPRTHSDFHNSFTFKMYAFEFVNTYSSLFYVAFFQSSLINGNPVKYRRISGKRIEECHPSGCLIDVCIQLFVIMVGKQFLRFLLDFVYPTIRKHYNDWRHGLGRDDNENLPQWEIDYLLSPEIEFRMFHEYLDMVIQFGFVTMFVASFPLAPLFALMNNIVELRTDAYNFVVNYRRRVAEQARNIGIWFKILEILTKISVLINSFVIAFTTDFIPRLVYYYGYSPDRSLRGYVNNSLTFINISDLEQSYLPDNPLKNLNYTLPYCRFKEYLEPQEPYDISKQFLHVMLIRMVFVIVFQYFVFFIKDTLSWLVPDIPSSLKKKIRRKMHMARMCFRKSAVEAIRESSKTQVRQRRRQTGSQKTADLQTQHRRLGTNGKTQPFHTGNGNNLSPTATTAADSKHYRPVSYV